MLRNKHANCSSALALIFIWTLGFSGVALAENEIARVDGHVANAPFTLLMPEVWNGNLVLLVHGSIPEEFEALGQGLAAAGFGVAFATLRAGLGGGAALKEITIHTRIAQAQFSSHFGQPDRTFLLGFSRGAHIMTHLLETAPAQYSGMLSICGGNGGAQLQWDYFFTARVLFDYYFPGVLPGTPLQMPPLDINGFMDTVAPDVIDAILANPAAAADMAEVDQYALQYDDFNELVSGILQSLVIHSTGVNDLISAAHGNPFDNTAVAYSGTSDDQALNRDVARLSAKPQARKYLQVWYEPDGTIAGVPVLLLHTSRDPIVPESGNNDKYEALVQAAGNETSLVRRVVDRFGHCSFTDEEIAGSFTDLVVWAVAGIKPTP
jgi:pimeloyl-ACP methyl ester carboxylesterase